MKFRDEDTAIITYIDRNNEENLLNDFLPTLFEAANYTGLVVILEYGIDKEIKDAILKKYKVELVECNITTDIFVDRYRDISDVITKLPGKIKSVVTMDSGDIWFQDSLDDFFTNEPGIISTVCEERIWDIDEWALKCINMLKDSDKRVVLKKLEGVNVRNSGVISGERNAVRDLSENVYRDIISCGYSFFGIDQIYVNYEIAIISEEKRRTLNERYNYVLVSNVGKFIIEDDIVYSSDGEKIAVVHNAGGNWRILNRPFLNKWSNPEQYTIENVKNLNVKEV